MTAGERTVLKVELSEQDVEPERSDGRRICISLGRPWRLSAASPAQRRNCRLVAGGIGVHGPDIDEDITAHGMLYGSPAKSPEEIA